MESDDIAVVLKDLLQRYDRLFEKPLPYVMAIHGAPPGKGLFHLHLEFYRPNRSAMKFKYLAGSESGAGAFIVDARRRENRNGTPRRLNICSIANQVLPYSNAGGKQRYLAAFSGTQRIRVVNFERAAAIS